MNLETKAEVYLPSSYRYPLAAYNEGGQFCEWGQQDSTYWGA